MIEIKTGAPEGAPISAEQEYHTFDHAAMLSFAQSYLMKLPDGHYTFFKEGEYWNFRASVGGYVFNIGGDTND